LSALIGQIIDCCPNKGLPIKGRPNLARNKKKGQIQKTIFTTFIEKASSHVVFGLKIHFLNL